MEPSFHKKTLSRGIKLSSYLQTTPLHRRIRHSLHVLLTKAISTEMSGILRVVAQRRDASCKKFLKLDDVVIEQRRIY